MFLFLIQYVRGITAMYKRERRLAALGTVFILAGCLWHPCVHGQVRGVQDTTSLSAALTHPGPYYALVIGNKNYRYLPSLQTPINDANAVAKLLHDVFGFQTKVLLDADRNQIMTALVQYRTSLPENSNLLIYYAGHGHHDRDTDEAYWLPVDALADNNSNWVSADDVTRDVRAIRSAHVLVISDSCYSGYMTRYADAAINPTERDAYLGKMMRSKSRNLMSSGGDEPVADNGAPGHSVFAWAVIESLRQMDVDQFSAADVFQELIKPKVGGRSEQLPQYSWIRNSGHDSGDFVFFRQPVAAADGAAAGVTGAGSAGITPRAAANPPANLAKATGKSAEVPAGALPAGMDPSLADLYRRAEAGNSQAMFELGWDYADGKGVRKDETSAVVWYRKAADAGEVNAMNNLALMYMNGTGVSRDNEQALSWFRKASSAGHAGAMVGLGYMYEHGYAVPQSYQEAVNWYRKGAEAGEPTGMKNLAFMYLNGYGVDKSYQQALTWYRKSTELGNADAMAGLGFMYEHGYGVGQDYRQAASWYRKSAEAGDATGMKNLGWMYLNGYGVDKDYQQALNWYHKAADLGNSDAMTSLGYMSDHGYGMERNYQQAVAWYRKAAAAGNAMGMKNLGVMYEDGYGVDKDQQQAISWYRKAAQLGDTDAKDALKRLGQTP